MNTQGRKEVGEAVCIAGLTALVVSLANAAVNYGCDAIDREIKRRKKKRKQAEKAKREKS